MSRANPKSSHPIRKTRTRRTEDQRIAELQAKIEHLKSRAASKAAKRDPTLRHVTKAIKSIDSAMSATGDAALRTALQEARMTLSACLQLQGAGVPQSSRSRAAVDPDSVQAYVRSNPGQRGEHIAAALGTDTKSLRGPMKRLIEESKIRTKGERRGMQYFAV
ncbi:MAG: hypothetical protein ACKVXR_10020 [Planctomycetota bacterium]